LSGIFGIFTLKPTVLNPVSSPGFNRSLESFSGCPEFPEFLRQLTPSPAGGKPGRSGVADRGIAFGFGSAEPDGELSVIGPI
jgi:hypothetical protein